MLLNESKNLGVRYVKKVFVLFILLLLIPTVYSLAASIGNARVVLRVNATPEDPAIIPRTILVQNNNDEAVLVSLTPSSEFERFVDIIDNEFELLPGEEKQASFILTIDRGGKIEGRISVGYTPVDPESKGAPVGLLSTIVILSDGPIIEEPEEQPETVQPEAEEPEVEVEEKVEETHQPDVQEAQENETETEIKPVAAEGEGEPAPQSQAAAPNPIVGIAIVALVVIVGLSVFFLITKLK